MSKKAEKEVEFPFGPEFRSVWDLWKEYKQEAHKFKYKSAISEQMAIMKLVEIAKGQEDIAIAIIKKSIENQWKGLHPMNTPYGKQPISAASEREQLNNAVNKRFGRG